MSLASELRMAANLLGLPKKPVKETPYSKCYSACMKKSHCNTVIPKGKAAKNLRKARDKIFHTQCRKRCENMKPKPKEKKTNETETGQP